MTDVLLCAQMRTARGAVQQCHWHCQWSTQWSPPRSVRARAGPGPSYLANLGDGRAEALAVSGGPPL